MIGKIDDIKYQEILDSGLILDHYFLLLQIKKGEKPLETKRVQGFINLLTKKGYLQDDQLTELGEDLLLGYESLDIVPLNSEGTNISSDEFEAWVQNLHEKCRVRIKELTGRSQYMLKVQGNSYPYLPGIKDLAMKVQKFMRVYKYNDLEKIEKCILHHCEVRNQKLIYYIIREKGDAKSDLAVDYENFDDIESPEQGYRSSQKLL